MKYAVEKVSTKRKLKKKVNFEGYSMKPKLKARVDFIEVKEIVVVNHGLKKKVLKRQFATAFKRMLKMIMNIIESDDTTSSSDAKIAYSELERMKRILKEKYKQEVSVREFSNMWRKVDMLETELKRKLEADRIHKMMWKQMMEMQENVEESKGRGR